MSRSQPFRRKESFDAAPSDYARCRSGYPGEVVDDVLIKRHFGPSAELDTRYVGDITFIWTWPGFAHLLVTFLPPSKESSSRPGPGALPSHTGLSFPILRAGRPPAGSTVPSGT